jgi:hypothetical protein
MTPSGVPVRRADADPWLRYLAGWAAGAGPALAMITLLWLFPGPSTPFGIVGLGAYALAFPVMVRRLGIPPGTRFVVVLVVLGLAFAVLSILTGWGNGLTDEGFTTPRFAGFLLAGHDPYTTAMTIAYSAYGRHFVSTSYYVYLPLLMFFQVPGVPYKWFSLACWVLLVALVRRRFSVATLLAQPYVMLVAENGYNDLVLLVLLTVAFVGVEGRRSKWAEWIALGCKQFANVVVLAYYAARCDWRNFLVTAGVSAAFVLPFFLWGGDRVLCPTILTNRPAFCPHTGGIQLLINYPVWAVWIFAVFYAPALLLIRRAVLRPRWRRWLVRWAVETARRERLPSLVIVAATSVVTGLALFVVAVELLGARGAGPFAAAAIATPIVVLWGYAWGGPWNRGEPGSAEYGDVRRRLWICQAALVVADLGVAWAWAVVGGSPLEGEGLGLAVGVAVWLGLTVRWDLAGPREEPGNAPPPAAPASG